MENYDNKCDIHFVSKINNKYKISFYSDEDNKKFIVLKNNNKLLWCKYKILCSYDIKKNILKKASDMIIIEQYIIDDKINYKSYKNIDELETYIMNNILNYYIGYVVKQDKNIIYFFGIDKIIRF